MLKNNDSSYTCLICGNSMKAWFTKQERKIFHCIACRLVQVPAGVLITDSGVSIYEDNENNVFLKYESYYLDETNILSCRKKLEWIKNFVPEKKRLLDAGANLGQFLKVAQDYYDSSGFELSPMAVEWSKKHFGVSNQVASIYDLPENLKGPFDVVTCWDVIEHLADPLNALEQIHKVLKPGGYLFLSTPDAGSFAARFLGRNWYYLDPVEHLTLFTRDNLKKALDLTGFEVVCTRSFGHYYRLRYIFDRLLDLYQSGPLRWGALLGMKIFWFALNSTIYLKFFDVMGLVARRKA